MGLDGVVDCKGLVDKELSELLKLDKLDCGNGLELSDVALLELSELVVALLELSDVALLELSELVGALLELSNVALLELSELTGVALLELTELGWSELVGALLELPELTGVAAPEKPEPGADPDDVFL